MKKKVIALFMVAIMCCSLLTGCKGKSKDAETSADDTSVSTQEETATVAPTKAASGELSFPKLPDNTLSIKVSIPNFGTSPEGTKIQQKWQEKMEAYLGCKLAITWTITPWQDFRTNEPVLLQSGDLPDVSSYSQASMINEYGADGVVLDIAKYKDYMQYYPSFVKDTNGGEKFAYNPDGTAYYFMDGFVNPDNNTGAQSFTSFAYRFDLLKKFNLTPASTLEEFSALCANVKKLIEDGKIDAKYVMTNSDKNYAFYRGFVGIFHTWDTTYWNGSSWSFGPIEDNFREMLKYLNGLYNAGYIDPEFATDDGAACTEKAVNGNIAMIPTLWSGMARTWNAQSSVDGMQWGLAYLPSDATYGTAWKWGSKQTGKSLQSQMGIIISADTKYPEWVVRMIDYQYSDEMIELMNWGVEGDTYTKDASGNHTYSDAITKAEDPVQASSNLGIMAGGVCRTGIPFVPQTFESMTELLPTEPWWNAKDSFYEGQYWIESGKIGGEDSVSPFDRTPVLSLSDQQSTDKAELTTNCETYAKENALKFITGEWDVNNDKQWQDYVSGVKSQVVDFDGTIKMLLDKSDLSSISK